MEKMIRKLKVSLDGSCLLILPKRKNGALMNQSTHVSLAPRSLDPSGESRAVCGRVGGGHGSRISVKGYLATRGGRMQVYRENLSVDCPRKK